jgi:hypothetical protein
MATAWQRAKPSSFSTSSRQRLQFWPVGKRRLRLQVVAASLFLLLGKNLPQSGLSQGLSLAPILFLFFNANLVQMAIEEGASTGIVDDYTVWVVSSSFKLNTRIIRREILPQLER